MKKLKDLLEIKVHKPGLPDFPMKLNKQQYDRIVPSLDKQGYYWYGNKLKPSEWNPWTVLDIEDLNTEDRILMFNKEGGQLSWKRPDGLHEEYHGVSDSYNLDEIKVHEPGLPKFPIEIDSKETFDKISNILNKKGYTYLDGNKLKSWVGANYPYYIFDEGNNKVSEWIYIEDNEMDLNEIKVNNPVVTIYMVLDFFNLPYDEVNMEKFHNITKKHGYKIEDYWGHYAPLAA